MKTDKAVLQDLDHLEMLKRPHLWPRWPALPLKRWRDGRLDTAIILEDEGDFVLFYRGATIYQRPGEWGVPVPRTSEEIVADGWVVD